MKKATHGRVLQGCFTKPIQGTVACGNPRDARVCIVCGNPSVTIGFYEPLDDELDQWRIGRPLPGKKRLICYGVCEQHGNGRRINLILIEEEIRRRGIRTAAMRQAVSAGLSN